MADIIALNLKDRAGRVMYLPLSNAASVNQIIDPQDGSYIISATIDPVDPVDPVDPELIIFT